MEGLLGYLFKSLIDIVALPMLYFVIRTEVRLKELEVTQKFLSKHPNLQSESLK